MFACKEVFILIFAVTVLTSSNRHKRDLDPLILGGSIPAEPVKSVVAIIRKRDKSDKPINQPICSGTLISDNTVLTAAHCFEDDNLTNIKIVAGEMDIDGKKAVTRSIKKLNIHPDYKFIRDKRFVKEGKNDEEEKRVQLLDGDLALLELDKPIRLENHDNIAKAELPTFSMKLTNTLVQIGGWGRTTTTLLSKDFLSINITIKTSRECSETYKDGSFFPDRMFCAGTGSQTSCEGDSGGGALYHGWGVPLVVGVVSYGKMFCPTFAVYTRVDKYLPWIFSKTNLKSPFVYLAEEETWMVMRDNLLQDLSQPRTVLYLSDSKVVSVPSFTAVEGCRLPPYPEAWVSGAVSGVVNNRLFVCGGYANKAELSSCYSLDHGRWWLQQPLNSKRYLAAASLSPLGLMVTGGWSDDRIRSSTEVLSPTGWIPGPALPEPVFNHCQISIGSVVIIIGGHTGGASAAVYALDKDKNTWTPLAGMQNARWAHACIVLGNNIVVMGGGGGASTSVEFYDLLEDKWTTGPDLDRGMDYGHATVHDGRLFAIYMDGLVMEMAGDRTAWIETGAENIGSLDHRRVFPAPLLTEEMLGC